MLPIRDNIPSRRFPAATLAIIAVNTLIFLWELQLGPRRLEIALWDLAIVPVRYSDADAARYFRSNALLPFFSSMFLHGGWLHLIGNMWTLWIFGDNVEDRLGRGRFVALYLASGVAAAGRSNGGFFGWSTHAPDGTASSSACASNSIVLATRVRIGAHYTSARRQCIRGR